MTDVRLNEYDRTEWWDMARRFMPGVTEEEFEVMWAEFQKMKAQKALS